MKNLPHYAFAFLAFLLPLLLYIKTLAPTYFPPDSSEFTLCVQYVGICHPPAFPLYVIIGKMLTLFMPFDSVVGKVNFLSALFGALGILMVYLISVKLKTDNAVAFLLSLVFAVTPAFWELTTKTEVFTFGVFLLCLSLYFLFAKRYLLTMFVLGLTTSHFYLTAILLPLFLWDLSKPKKTIRELGIGLLLFLIGSVGPQLFMFGRMLQNPVIDWGHVHSIGGFIDFVRRKEFGSFFIISSPSAVFTFDKMLKHYYVYFYALLRNFVFLLPIVGIAGLVMGKSQKIFLLVLSFVFLLSVQLLSISTFDPTVQHSPIDFTKFYLSTFLIAVLLMGIGLTNLTNRLAFHHRRLFLILFMFFPLFLFISNFQARDLSKNEFSRNLILDALGELPPNSIAITINHQFFFGSRYEQLVNNAYTSLRLVYYPNDNNTDAKLYNPDLFIRAPNIMFQNSIMRGKNVYPVQQHILDLITRNLNRHVFLLQGAYEESVFGYLKPYMKPYGLWWEVQTDPYAKGNLEKSAQVLSTIRNANFTDTPHLQESQYLEPLVYAYGFAYNGIRLAQEGQYEKSLVFLKKSKPLLSESPIIPQSIAMITEVGMLDKQKKTFMDNHDEIQLLKLGSLYYNIGNYKASLETFSYILSVDPNSADNFNNVASSYAQLGRKNEAIENYRKALSLNPNLTTAKNGLENLLQ